MLAVVDTFGEDLPPACASTCQESWAIIDTLLTKFGTQYDIAERATRVLRGGLRFFGSAALPVVPSVLARMSIAFEVTGFSSYAWIAGKAISLFGEEDNPDMRLAIKDVYERSTSKLVTLLRQKQLNDIPDGKTCIPPKSPFHLLIQVGQLLRITSICFYTCSRGDQTYS